LQRTFTPPGPTFSSEIMYCALQFPQENLIGQPGTTTESPSRSRSVA
jgi:hypothetical protein